MSEPFVTIFHDKYGHRINAARPMDLFELERVIRAAPAATEKEKLPLLKLARFGEVLSKKHGFRSNENVLAIHGIEGDYDAGLVPMSQAAEALSAAGVAALLYTSANHTPDFHKWRVLVALSTPLEGTMEQLKAQRRHWCGVLNSILGGILETESFVLSQSYFFGPIKGRPVPEILRLSGVCLDQLEDIPKPVFMAKPKAANGAAGEKHEHGTRDPRTDAQLLAIIASGRDRYASMRALSSRWAGRGIRPEDIEANLLHALGENYVNHAGVDLRPRAHELAVTAWDKYADPREKARKGYTFDAQSPEQKDDDPIALLAFDLSAILQPIPPERYLVAGVPCEAYTLIAGALSSYKSTMLLYMLILRATGYDFLNLDKSGIAGNIGPAVLIFYEDTDKRVLAKLYRILQSGYAQIQAVYGERAARDFLDRAAKNIRRIAFTGQFHRTIVARIAGMVLPNEKMIEELLAKVREFTGSDILIGIDPLRLAIVGSQNDDDGADVVVHTLNRLAVEIPDSGIIVCSHTTKSGAQDPAEGYTGKAYATSGSALYSQHARSNFHMTRIKPDEIAKLFSATDVPASEYARQPVALLTHGRLSHGAESHECYMRMDKGILVPLKPRQPRSAAEISDGYLPNIAMVIDDIHANKRLASETALCADERLLHTIGNHHKIRAILKLLDADGYIEFTGKTRDRDGSVTDKGRAAAASGTLLVMLPGTRGTNWNESLESDE